VWKDATQDRGAARRPRDVGAITGSHFAIGRGEASPRSKIAVDLYASGALAAQTQQPLMATICSHEQLSASDCDPAMTCAHCRRTLAGVAVLFEGKPAVCGRADCLAWARAQKPLASVVEVSFQRPAADALRPAA
jgi:hypothetical protein